MISLEERLQQEPIRLLLKGGRLDVVLRKGAPDGYVLPNDVDELLADVVRDEVDHGVRSFCDSGPNRRGAITNQPRYRNARD